MDQINGCEVDFGPAASNEKPDSVLMSPDTEDVWGGHLNKEKATHRTETSSPSTKSTTTTKRPSHSSIFSKLLANDVIANVPKVKSAKQMMQPFSKNLSKTKTVTNITKNFPDSKLAVSPPDTEEPVLSSVVKHKEPDRFVGGIFSSTRKSIFMRRSCDVSCCDEERSFKSSANSLANLISQRQRSNACEAFSCDEPFDVELDNCEKLTSSAGPPDGVRGSIKPSIDFTSSLLRSGNPERKPRQTKREVIASFHESLVNASKTSAQNSPYKISVSQISSLPQCEVDSVPTESVSIRESPQKCSPKTVVEPSVIVGVENPIEQSRITVSLDGDGKPSFSKLSGNQRKGNSNDTIDLASAWNRKVDEETTTSVRSEIAAVKRRRSTAGCDTPEKKSAPKRVKASAGGGAIVSDNYVRINLKKKRFVRGAKTLTGPKYKRQQWKQRMKARAGESDRCFKCGESGHWANKCSGNAKPAGSTIVDADVLALREEMEISAANEDDTYPTMEDAAAMAQGIKSKTMQSKRVTSIYPEKRKAKKLVQLDDNSANCNNKSTEYDFPDDEDDGTWLLEAVNSLESSPKLAKKCSDSSNSRDMVGPVLQLKGDKLPETPAVVWNALKTFGHKSFRPGQEEAVMRILCGQSTLVILSTGAGKSLCYKLPAYLYGTRKQAITLVISPLVSLMEDQVADLPPGVHGACLHTNMTPAQRKKIAQDVYNNKVHFLLMSPESLVGGGNNSGIINFSKMPPVAFACIDEAHCLSEWSHHFRPSYLRVCKVLREQLNVTCMLGLTATATMTTAVSVARHLHITDLQSAFIRGVPVPPNLVLSVSKDERRLDALIELLQGDRFRELNSIIIYCTRRQETEQIATRIRTCLGDKTKPKPKGRAKKYEKQTSDEPLDWDAEPYHAGLSAAARKRVQNLFMSGRLKVVVATVAFGMGLDKADVRSVIHYNLPKTFESYVQEMGRAGRDGQTAHCHVFLDEDDLCELKKHTYGNTIDRYILKKFVRTVFPPCKCKEIESHCGSDPGEFARDDKAVVQRLCHGHQRAVPIELTTTSLNVREEGFGTLLCYLELHPKRWVQNHRPTYSTCTLRCYSGQQQLKELARTCPPVAAAVAWTIKNGKKPSNQVTFPVVEIADMMGWDAGPVKRELYSLQWTRTNAGPRKSGVLVEFSDLAFHFRSPGDLSDEELDEVTDFMHDRVQMQERVEIHQLKRLYDTLRQVAFKDYSRCSDYACPEKSYFLRKQLLEYFDEPPEHDPADITVLSFAREMDLDSIPDEQNSQTASSRDNYQLLSDIHAFINTYSADHSLTGRDIARIFQGIGSPCFPIEVWGKVRRFWRSHLTTDFNLIRTTATKELMKFR